MVLLEKSATKISKNAKLKDHWEGPYEVIDAKRPQNITIKLKSRGRTTKEVHVSQVKKYYDRADFILVMEIQNQSTINLQRTNATITGDPQVRRIKLTSPLCHKYYNRARNKPVQRAQRKTEQ